MLDCIQEGCPEGYLNSQTFQTYLENGKGEKKF